MSSVESKSASRQKLDLPPSKNPQALARFLIDLAVQRRWQLLDDMLGGLGETPEIRGAVLMQALNMAPPPCAHRLLPYMIFYGAPLEVIERALALGAVASMPVSVHETSTRRAIEITHLHLAVLKNRFDVAALLIREGHSSTVFNAQGESPAEQFARLAPRAQLDAEATATWLGPVVRRAIAEGLAPEHVFGAIRTLCLRKAWTIAETLLDEFLLAPGRGVLSPVSRAVVSELAWIAAMRRAPDSLLQTLRAIQHSERATGEPGKPAPLSSKFMLDGIPKRFSERSLSARVWNRLGRRLNVLERVADLTHPDFARGVLDDNYTPFLPSRLQDQLIVLGIEEPPHLQGSWSLAHWLIGNAAPRELLDRALALGPNLALRAFLVDNGEIVCDGTPLHFACARRNLEYIESLLRRGAPVTALNSQGAMPLHTLLVACEGNLDFPELPAFAAFLRAGAPLQNRSSDGRELENQLVLGIRVQRLMVLLEEYRSRVAEGSLVPAALTPDEQRYPIELDGKLVEVNETQLRAQLARRLQTLTGVPSKSLRMGELSLDDLLRLAPYRSAFETLRRSLENRLDSQPPRTQATTDEWEESGDSQVEDRWDIEDEDEDEEEPDDEPAWLEFPELGDDDRLDELDDFDAFGTSPEEESDFENEFSPATEPLPDSSPLPAGSPEATFEDLVEEALAGEPNAVSDPGYSKPGDPESFVVDVTVSEDAGMKLDDTASLEMISAVGFQSSGRQSYINAALDFLEEGSPHECLLMLEAIREVKADSPTLLNATTRILRSLLFRAPPGIAQYLGILLDQAFYNRENGYHPYMAEYLCLLNHPYDERRNISSLGGLSLGISSIAQLAAYGNMRGDLLHEYGRIGALNFSFPFWRFDAQPIQPAVERLTLFEQAGMARHTAATEHWVNPATQQSEHLWGPAFSIAPGDGFHDSFDNEEAERLGYAPLSPHTTIVFRRAGVFVGTEQGVLLWRNSSLLFGRDRFKHPALLCPEPLGKREILGLAPQDIERGFHSITGRQFFEDQQARPRRGEAIRRAAQRLKHFNDQFQTVRARYARLKFDTHLETAWSRDGKQLLGGYRSPLFRSVVAMLEDRFQGRPPGGKPAIETLAVCNPDYPPYAPHASLTVTERSLECLRQLAEGREFQVSSRALRETGIEGFMSVALRRGRNSELVLLPARG